MSSVKYSYKCKECGAPAIKPACAPHEPGKPALATLGTWHCSAKCTKGRVSVTRHKAGVEGK